MKPANTQGSRPYMTSVRRLCIPCVIQPANTHSSRRVLSYSQPQMFGTSTSPQEFQRPQNPIRDLFITGVMRSVSAVSQESAKNTVQDLRGLLTALEQL